MLTRTVLSLPLLALTMASGSGFAQNQETPPQKFYRLEFVVKEVEGGKVLNARTYSTTVAADAKDLGSTSIRTGGRVPIETKTGDIKSLQYLDIGVNIDCRAIREVERALSLYVSADISSVPSDAATPGVAPTIRQNRWSSLTIVPLKKPTLIFSSDDPTSKRQMQLELTATPIT